MTFNEARVRWTVLNQRARHLKPIMGWKCKKVFKNVMRYKNMTVTVFQRERNGGRETAWMIQTKALIWRNKRQLNYAVNQFIQIWEIMHRTDIFSPFALGQWSEGWWSIRSLTLLGLFCVWLPFLDKLGTTPQLLVRSLTMSCRSVKNLARKKWPPFALPAMEKGSFCHLWQMPCKTFAFLRHLPF